MANVSRSKLAVNALLYPIETKQSGYDQEEKQRPMSEPRIPMLRIPRSG